MSNRGIRYIRADLQKDPKGQLFVKANLDVLDVLDQIDADREYFSNFNNMVGPDLLKVNGFSFMPKRDNASAKEDAYKYNRPGTMSIGNIFTSMSEAISNNKLVDSEKLSNKTYVTKEMLEKIKWEIDDAGVESINHAMWKYGITTPERIRHFLSQIALESDKGRAVKEYGPDSYFIDLYSDRDDLGNEGPEDALKYRGSGYIQLTGKDNYKNFAEAMNDPRILTEGYTYVAEKYPAEAAAFWWDRNEMNQLVDENRDQDVSRQVILVSARVNGFDPNGIIPEEAHVQTRMEYYRELQKYNF